MHQNLNHPPEAEFVRRLLFAQASVDTVETAKALRCAVCLRDRYRHQVPGRPASLATIRVFNEVVGMDIFYVTDIADEIYPMVGIIDYATLFHLVYRISDATSYGILAIVNMVWFSWAGPPVKCS